MKKIGVLIGLLLTTGIAFAQTPRIEFMAAQAYPEGIAWDAAGRKFYVSSVTDGNIGSVDMTGQYKIVYKDSSVKSSFGMKVDSATGILWVCTGDPNYSKRRDTDTYRKAARVIGIDIKTGKKIKDIDLEKLYAGQHFINDLTIDPTGNIYATDSYSPVIYKIDSAGNATVFAESPLFKAKDIGLNGIAWHPDGFLLTVNNGNGTILKVDIKNPQRITTIQTTCFFPGADGLLLNDRKQLLLVQNKGVDKVFLLSSPDGWKTAAVMASTSTEDRFQNPTTSTFAAQKVYALNAKLNELKDKSKTPSNAFSIQEVQLRQAGN